MNSNSNRLLCSALALLSLALLGWLASCHPGLQQVDFLSFSGRARRLSEGQDWLHPMYPVGYPILLWTGRLPGLDLLLAGKLISVLATAGVVLMASRWLHPIAGLWLLAQGAVLKWGSTEGTDMLAATLSLGAVLSAEKGRSKASGALLGLALMVRYTAAAALPMVVVLLWMQATRENRVSQLRRALLTTLLCTLPHWLAAVLLLRSPIPDQGFNLAVGAGAPTELLSMDTLRRWPHGAWMALQISLADWTARLGALGIVLGLIKRDARAFALVGLALLHVSLIGLAFGNDRLLLPASMAWSLGIIGVLPTRIQVRPRAIALLLLVVTSVYLASWHLPQMSAKTEEEMLRYQAQAKAQDLPGPLLSSTPWVYQVRDGWLEQSIPIREAAFDPELGHPVGDHSIGPEQVHHFALQMGIRALALDTGRVGATYPSLRPMLRPSPPAGFTRSDEIPGWVFLQVE